MFATGTDRGVCRDKTSSACFHPRSPLSITILFSDKEKQDDNDDDDDDDEDDNDGDDGDNVGVSFYEL